jgi:hypothetical protein
MRSRSAVSIRAFASLSRLTAVTLARETLFAAVDAVKTSEVLIDAIDT